MPHGASPFGVVTVSVSHATSQTGSAIDGTAIIKRADDALYRAKKAGRNRIEGPGTDENRRVLQAFLS